MVLLDEAPEFLIHEVLSNFNISSDMHSVTRINETLARITSEWKKIKDDSDTTLCTLSRKAEISKQSMEATASAAGRKEHGANMLRLDREKFALAKGINELESSAHGLEGQLARLKEELEQVDGEDPMQSALVEAEDGTLLKLKVYRSLGIDLQEDGAAGYSKAVIRNSSKGDIHVVNIERKFSHFFYANYFWNVM